MTTGAKDRDRDPDQARFNKGDAARMAKALARNPQQVCEWLFPAGEIRGNDFCIGDVAGNQGQSLRVCLGGPHAGKWLDHAEEDHRGDLLNLVFLHFGCRTIGEAMAEVPDNLTAGAEIAAAEPVARVAQAPRANQAALTLWHEGQPILKTPADAYFARRHFAPRNSRFYRYHPRAEYRFKVATEPHLLDLADARLLDDEAGVGTVPVPAILFRVTDSKGRFLGLNRRFINLDGTATTHLADAKKSLGPVSQGTIWHTFAGKVQIIAEGAPDGLAITTALPRAAVWSATAGPHIPHFVEADETKTIIIARQQDSVGEWSAAELRQRARLRRPGLIVIEHGSTTEDFAADLATLGAEHVAAGFRAAYRQARQ